MLKWVLIQAICLSYNSWAKTIEFSLSSKDGLARLNGQLDVPSCNQNVYPAVLMVGGTGLFTRRAYFGRSGTGRDFIFDDLAERLNSVCIVAVRFDYRGVQCDILDQASLGRCIDQNVRASVSDKTILEDIRSVYEFASQSKLIDSNKVYILGHSEGSLNTSRLIAEGLNPAGVLFIGGITESAKSIINWQIVKRTIDWAFSMDYDRDGILTNDEIWENFPKTFFSKFLSPQAFLSPTGSWTLEAFTNTAESQYAELVRAALEKEEAAPHQANGVVFSSHAWWKRWFTDDKSVLENLSQYSGSIKYHGGDFDMQVPASRQENFFKTIPFKMKSKPVFVTHVGKGHGLSSDPLYGPIDEDIANHLVADFLAWSKSP